MRAGGVSLPAARPVAPYLFAATAFWGISIGLVSVALPFRFQQLGLPIFQYGVTLAGFAGGMLLSESVWGHLALRVAHPRPIIGMGVVVAATTVLLAFATNFLTFFVAEALLGAMGVYLAPVLRWVALSTGGPGTQGAGSGRWSSALRLGMAIGLALGPLEFVATGFRVVALSSVGVLAVAVALAAALPWSRVDLPPPARRSGPRRSLTTTPFLVSLGLVLLAFTAMTFTTNFLPYYSLALFGGTPTEAGYVLGAGRLVSLTASFVLGSAVDRWGARRSIPAGFALLLVGGVATWFSGNYVEMVAATMIFSAGVGWLSASLLPFALNAVSPGDQGTAIGVFGSVEDGGLLVGPLLFGTVWSTAGPSGIFPVVAAVAAAGVVASVVASSLASRPAGVEGATGKLASRLDPD